MSQQLQPSILQQVRAADYRPSFSYDISPAMALTTNPFTVTRRNFFSVYAELSSSYYRDHVLGLGSSGSHGGQQQQQQQQAEALVSDHSSRKRMLADMESYADHESNHLVAYEQQPHTKRARPSSAMMLSRGPRSSAQVASTMPTTGSLLNTAAPAFATAPVDASAVTRTTIGQSGGNAGTVIGGIPGLNVGDVVTRSPRKKL